MAKKVRFPLIMEDGVEVRDMSALREHFSLPQVLLYLSNGKLVTWLKDRFADSLAAAVEQLDPEDKELPKKICEIFDVPYDDAAEEDLEKAKERERKRKLLQEHGVDEEYNDVVDSVAFDQDDLYDLLDEQVDKIYLCGERFSIPLDVQGMTYIGICNPVVVIDSKTEVDWDERQISLSGVKYDEKYQAVVDSAAETKSKLYERLVDVVKSQSTQAYPAVEIGPYSSKSYLNFMLSPADKKAAEESYDKIRGDMGEITYDADRDIRRAREMLLSEGIIDLAEKYIENL